MKKGLILLFAMMATLTANAQFYVGGTVGVNSAKPDGGDAVTTFSIMPEIGYNFSDNFAVGATLGYAKAANDYMNDLCKTFTIAPYARYTFLKTDLLNLFVDGEVSYSNIKEDVDGAESVSAFGIHVKPGLAVNVSDNISLIAKYGLLGYDKIKDYGSNFGFNINASKIEFGFIYNF